MEKEERAYLWLSMCDSIGVKKAFALINKYGSCVEVLNNVDKLADVLKPQDFERAKYTSDNSYIDTYISNCNKQDIKIPLR